MQPFAPGSPGRWSAGQKSQPPHYSFRTGDYDRFQVICLLRGRLFYKNSGTKTAMAPGMLALLRLGSAFSLHTGPIGYQGVYFITTGIDQPSFRGDSEVLTASPEIMTIARMMDAEIAAPGWGSRELLNGLGLILAWKSIRLSRSNPETGSGRDWAEVARAALDATLTTGRSAREVLAGIGISYRQLSRYFTRTYGRSPKQYQVAARIEEAGRLLAQTSYPVTSIAFELGYPSSQHFATQFRKETGLTPTGYRAAGAAAQKRRRKPAR